MLLAVADTLHLVFSLSSFSLPTLVPAFYSRAYKYTLPYTLPLAQVSKQTTLNPTNSVGRVDTKVDFFYFAKYEISDIDIPVLDHDGYI
jgi:hypothetical protein